MKSFRKKKKKRLGYPFEGNQILKDNCKWNTINMTLHLISKELNLKSDTKKNHFIYIVCVSKEKDRRRRRGKDRNITRRRPYRSFVLFLWSAPESTQTLLVSKYS